MERTVKVVKENREVLKEDTLGLNNLKLNSEFKPNDKKLRGKLVTGVDQAPQLRPDFSSASLHSEKLDAVLQNTYKPNKDSDDEFEL